MFNSCPRIIRLALWSGFFALQGCLVGEKHGKAEPDPKTFSLVQTPLQSPDAPSQPLAIFPAFHPDSLIYAATLAGPAAVVLYAQPGPKGSDVQLIFEGDTISPSETVDGTLHFALTVAAPGTARLVFENAGGGAERSYRIRFVFDRMRDANAPGLKVLSMERVFYYRSAYFEPVPITPTFSPDTLDYGMEEDGTQTLRVSVSPMTAGDTIWMTYNGVRIENGSQSAGSLNYQFSFTGKGLLQAVAGDPQSGKQTTYSLRIRKPEKVDDGEWARDSMSQGPMGFGSIDFISDSIGFGFGQDSRFYKTTDGGRTWEIKSEALGFYPWIDFVDLNRGYGRDVFSNSLFRTDDGGLTWTKCAPLGATDGGYTTNSRISFLSRSTGYVAAGSRLFMTRDSGTTWTDLSPGPTEGRLEDLAFLDSSLGYVVWDGGKVFKTSDGGGSWTSVFEFSNPPGAIPIINLVDSNTLLLQVGGMKAYISRDLGASWDVIGLPKSPPFRGMMFTSPGTGYLIDPTTSIGSSIYKTKDGGKTWSRIFYDQVLLGAPFPSRTGPSIIQTNSNKMMLVLRR